MAEKIEELRVKELLKEKNIKMYELANKMGITPESLTRALQRNPQFSTLKAIANCLEVSIRDLFVNENEQKEKNDEMRACLFYKNEMLTFNTRQELEDYLRNNQNQ